MDEVNHLGDRNEHSQQNLYHHFLALGPDHVHSQPPSPWGITFVLTAYLVLITEAIGTYVGVHFLWIAKEASNKTVKVRFR